MGMGTGQKWAQELGMTETLELGCGAAAAACLRRLLSPVRLTVSNQ